MNFVSEEMLPFFRQDINKFKTTVAAFQNQIKQKLTYLHDLDLTFLQLNNKDISTCLRSLQSYQQCIRLTAFEIEMRKIKKNKQNERIVNMGKAFAIDEIEHMMASQQGQFYLYTHQLAENIQSNQGNQQVVDRCKLMEKDWNRSLKIYQKFEKSLALFKHSPLYFNRMLAEFFKAQPRLLQALQKKTPQIELTIYIQFLKWKKYINMDFMSD